MPAQFDSEKIKGSIRSLKELYSGVFALALYEAIRGVAETPNVLMSQQFQFFLVAFCATLIPFYHGTMRYFDDSYFSTSSELKPGSFMLDYIFFCTSAGLLVWLGAMFGAAFNPDYFMRVYAGLLAMDIVWGFMTHFLTNSYMRVKYWLWLNFAVLFGIGLIWAWRHPFQSNQITMFLIIAPTRSILDYALNWNMYFPRVEAPAPAAAPAPAPAPLPAPQNIDRARHG
jgi:hypothetical protein